MLVEFKPPSIFPHKHEQSFLKYLVHYETNSVVAIVIIFLYSFIIVIIILNKNKNIYRYSNFNLYL